MEKNEIYAWLEEENGRQVVHVKADGDGMTLLEMTTNIAADLIKSNTDNKEVVERRKEYYISLIEDAVKDTGKEDKHGE